ncbi:L,D-transpeptidase [Bradyrhizobium sp. LHD-71]|uniref:L,D-transpeptidase n=1 Tax=Bradyrhizobium sp. LHD-71 TaxID=3072141 RepID=UPI00280E1690|nr:L,D-transpeptidase [Bradyrhizobium sp. LHD-71]MDQ8729911.1 L,D-transpeptidase [Bradyrhizobium sp. LHD-71]
MTAAALFAVPEAANAQMYWNWGPSDYYRPRYHAPQYEPEYEPRSYAPRSSKPRRAKVKRATDPAEAAADKAAAVANKAAKPVGPLVIAVSVERQRVKVYDSNGLFAEAPVSTGTKTNPTPYGVFSIIQKNRHHVSNLYGASMPYMQRITWSGVALHTGPLPGYAASHGCIRLPNEFASRLWTWTKMGTRVIVAPGDASPMDFSHPKLVARMVPLPTMSGAPTPVTVAETALSKSDRAAMAQQRTADARGTMTGIKGTLSDVTPAKNAEAKDTEARDTETKTTEGYNEPTTAGSNTMADGPQTVEAEVEAAAETKFADATEKPAELISVATAQSTEPKAKEKSAPTKSAAAASADVAEPAQEIARPADIITPSAMPAPAKPAPASTSRSHNHIAVFISRKDKKLYIRHGYEPIFDTPVEIADADRPLGTHVFTARGDKADTTALRWSVVSLPQVPRKSAPKREARRGTKAAPVPAQSTVIAPLNASEALDRITIPDEAIAKIASIITPGGSLLISDHGLNGWETGKGTDFIVPLR